LILELAYFEGMTQSEIADYLALPLGTIKSRLRLGVEKLERLLAASGLRKGDF
jgi:RNA polymerase sigma-70 factor (ECF subfamily)